uniref:NADH-ubiquinone oxidoreductase chain 5 n=1 Tax=Harmonia quadripunctata TaxID=346781 RepID=A0A343C304_HARQU|nr:NADH dehydrogenase subunit 5 [Harmonia quadripunctata]
MSVCFIFSSLLMMLFIMFFSLSMFLILLEKTYFIEFSIFNFNSLEVEMLVLVDWMSSLFISFVLLISSMVIFYSKSYMSMDKSMTRFVLLVFMFVFSMMLMIMSPNLISILLGWDGLGLVSYCLVIYYQNVKSYSAGMLTALSNRVGDVMLLMSIAWMVNFGSWNFTLYVDFNLMDSNIWIISILIILASMTKSAQIPFSAWLPAAMAAPTPVSALVHSSTLVTAGVYLLIRFHLLVNNFSFMLMFMGLMTMFMSGLAANFEYDLKKIIALSTLSQLGLMFVVLGLGYQELAFFHLLIHALFKALLFMCAGNFIHLMGNCQDIRFMGGLIYKTPMTVVYFNVSNFSLCGLPYFSGFYSKDLIMEIYSMSNLNLYIYFIMMVSLMLTVSYSVRLMYFLMYSDFKGFSFNSMVESKDEMLYGMGFMFLIVLFSGTLTMWILFKDPMVIVLPFFMKMSVLMMVVSGVIMGLEISMMNLNYKLIFSNFLKILMFLVMMWNLPYISTFGVNYFFINLGLLNYKFLDQGWSESLGSSNLFNFLKHSSVLLQYLFKNNLKIFLIMFLTWVIIMIIFF